MYMCLVFLKFYNKIESMGIFVILDLFNLIFFDRVLLLWLFVVGCIIVYCMRCLCKFVIMFLLLFCILIFLFVFLLVVVFWYFL